MKCPSCQSEVAPASKFCNQCGASLAGKPAAETAAGGGPQAGAAFPLRSPTTASSAQDPAAEQPVWQGRPSWRHYSWHWLLWGLGIVVLMAVASRFENMPWSWLLVVIVASALALALRQAWTIYSTGYRLTTQRLFFDRGIISRITDQTELVRVDDVRIRKHVLDRLVGTGTVIIVSSDQSDKQPVLVGIAQPDAVCEEIRRHTRLVRSRQTLFVESV